MVLKAPKTQSSVRKVFLPRTVAQMLVDFKKEQDYARDALGDEYYDYNLVICGSAGTPRESSVIQEKFTKLIEEHDLPKVVFHSLRHSSITYKLKLNGGDVKAVQGDSGHAQTSMVTEVYSHILDDDRRNNARLFEEHFYAGKGHIPEAPVPTPAVTDTTPGEPAADMATLLKMLSNPETAAMLKTLTAMLNPGSKQ
jgi:integrase